MWNGPKKGNWNPQFLWIFVRTHNFKTNPGISFIRIMWNKIESLAGLKTYRTHTSRIWSVLTFVTQWVQYLTLKTASACRKCFTSVLLKLWQAATNKWRPRVQQTPVVINVFHTIMFKKSCKIFGLFLLLQFVSAQNFPPGVPPPKPAQQNGNFFASQSLGKLRWIFVDTASCTIQSVQSNFERD